ncbi:helix-turn-helix domain-containing protein [Bdellovibrio sp. HCB2-146]|uniref:helix-turn-helix domain-containing protein n=1 Tax=Bdellovibrio sp. HCB2-146 TaxID=3394362 RepID=UPI0039BC3315
MKEFKSQRIKEAIKELLKKKGLTYENLAEDLECSVPTIKRILGPEELSLNRLLQLCDILDVDLADLEQMTKSSKEEGEEFTPDQEEFLAKNKNFFAYLMQIYSGETPKQIAQKHGLTDRSTDKYLIGLEKKGLIRVTGALKVKPAFKEMPGLGSGILGRTYFESLISTGARYYVETIRAAFRGDPDVGDRNTAKFSIQGLKVSRASYIAYTEQRNRAWKEFERLAVFEEKSMDEKDLMTAVIMEANTLVKNDHPTLKIIENTLGEITNI